MSQQSAPLITSTAIEAAITARELDPAHPVLPERFWTRPDVADAVARLDVTALIRRMRALTPITQDQIARLTGLTQSTISRIETGRSRLRDLARVRTVLTALGAPELPKRRRPNRLTDYTIRAVIADTPEGQTVVLHASAQDVAEVFIYTEDTETAPLPPQPTHPVWPPPR
ncbi:helix-turn-helix domain-containing protein [Thermobifida halotolerans]|uniref:Helix-turn-helix domain-containing protein n=1 Tax=Thermobifida halotolerans TaxID=483545 RepID=A0A399G1F1_9ACTN|nr:helix-turn-helix transcriptional regulator [Thermobifida halotolerans]UOE19326.1 helix-turn-helix domain-containing protein [Thermobifida halotolerans]